jgi:hypothetical protein
MAALDLALIPSNINTYERLAVWVMQALQSSANGVTVTVQNGAGALPIAQVQVGVTADNVERFILSAYLPLDSDALNDSTQKTWMATEDISSAAPHTNFLSN